MTIRKVPYMLYLFIDRMNIRRRDWTSWGTRSQCTGVIQLWTVPRHALRWSVKCVLNNLNPMDKGACNFVHYQDYRWNSNKASSVTTCYWWYHLYTRHIDAQNGQTLNVLHKLLFIVLGSHVWNCYLQYCILSCPQDLMRSWYKVTLQKKFMWISNRTLSNCLYLAREIPNT